MYKFCSLLVIFIILSSPSVYAVEYSESTELSAEHMSYHEAEEFIKLSNWTPNSGQFFTEAQLKEIYRLMRAHGKYVNEFTKDKILFLRQCHAKSMTNTDLTNCIEAIRGEILNNDLLEPTEIGELLANRPDMEICHKNFERSAYKQSGLTKKDMTEFVVLAQEFRRNLND